MRSFASDNNSSVHPLVMEALVKANDGHAVGYGNDPWTKEATEIVIAAKNPNANEIKYEISDFLYHMMVLMAEKDVTWEEITTELANR